MLGESANVAEVAVSVVLFIAMFGGFGGLIGWMIGRRKSRGGLGFILGATLGLIGWIIIACMGKPARQGLPIQNSAGWWPDPYGRNEVRWYDGQQWTHDVANGGKQTIEAAAPA